MVKIENYFIDIVGVINWFLKVALFKFPYFGGDFNDVDWADVSVTGEEWC